MRLLNAETLCFESFEDDRNMPIYAILSHTWGRPDDEVTFQELKDFDCTDNSRVAREERLGHKPGWRKITATARLAREDYYCRHIWVDTCCINKESSAELSEAINSMFRWYEHATVCIAYLADVEGAQSARHGESIRRSRWFTRGWTLQELIAPNIIIFFDAEWNGIGDNQDLHLLVEDITGIDRRYIRPRRDKTVHVLLDEASVATKMSWAANRQTTRPEDMAYCLLGIFDINMSLIYGEGNKAFLRLQQKIMKGNDDGSIFSWGYRNNPRSEDLAPQGRWRSTGLASHPSEFKNCRNIRRGAGYGYDMPSFSMTQKGLLMKMYLVSDPLHEFIKYGILGCAVGVSIRPRGTWKLSSPPLVIPLISSDAFSVPPRLMPGHRQIPEFFRAPFCTPAAVPQNFLPMGEEVEFFLRSTIPKPSKRTVPFQIRIAALNSIGCRLLGTYPPQPIGEPLFYYRESLGTEADQTSDLVGGSQPLSDGSTQKHGRDLQLVHFEFLARRLLIVFDYPLDICQLSDGRSDEPLATPLHLDQCIRVRVFEYEPDFQIGVMRRMAITGDFSSLREANRINLEEVPWYSTGEMFALGGKIVVNVRSDMTHPSLPTYIIRQPSEVAKFPKKIPSF